MSAATAGLESLLAAQHAAIYGYGYAGAELVRLQAPLGALAAVRTGFDANRLIRDGVSDTIASLGGTPPPAAAAYQLPFVITDTAGALRLLVILEDRVSKVAAAAVATPGDASRRIAADVLSTSAERTTRLRLLLNTPASRAAIAFPGLPGS
jgi:hypothetical protein